MLEAFHQGGLPAGLVNLVTGKGSEIGDYLTTHPSVNCISFTGGDTGARAHVRKRASPSSASAAAEEEEQAMREGRGAAALPQSPQSPDRSLLRRPWLCAGIAISKKAGMVPLQMELGGKDVCIVCADADLQLAAKHIVKGGFSYSGQRCTAVKLVFVDAKVRRLRPILLKGQGRRGRGVWGQEQHAGAPGKGWEPP